MAFAFVATACDPNDFQEVSGADTRCTPGQAQIAVLEGFVQNLCGCQEPGGVPTTSPITCTIAAGTVVFFQYQATTNVHQIVPVGSPAFAPASPPSDPAAALPVRSHEVVFGVAGTYLFEDQYYPSLISGQIVVQ